jgi:hypothetical protein
MVLVVHALKFPAFREKKYSSLLHGHTRTPVTRIRSVQMSCSISRHSESSVCVLVHPAGSMTFALDATTT